MAVTLAEWEPSSAAVSALPVTMRIPSTIFPAEAANQWQNAVGAV